MTDNNSWTRFLPKKLGTWLRGDDDDADQGAPAGGASTGSDPLLSYDPPGAEWTPGGEAPEAGSCPVCGTPYAADADPGAPCPKCGADRVDTQVPAGIADSPTHVLMVDQVVQPRRPCAACGGEVDIDGYCMTCGAKQESERDHFREEPARWLAGVCDRGIRHQRNEDAMALAASQEPGARGVLVVCDGVSTSVDSDVASLAGAQAARDVLSGNQPKGLGTPESRTAAMTQALTESAHAANRAVIEATALDSENAASATFAAAVISDGEIFYANLGDSRVYWFPDEGDDVQLSVDDSVAQARIEAGVPREQAENGEGAHSITKWLGRDSTDVDPRVGELKPEGSGWLLVCSDGLWNYASTPAELRKVLDAGFDDPQPSSIVDVCERMVAWANEQGGRDNITVALARLGGLEMLAPAVEQRVTVPAAPASPPIPAEPQPDATVFEQPDWAGGGAAPATPAPAPAPDHAPASALDAAGPDGTVDAATPTGQPEVADLSSPSAIPAAPVQPATPPTQAQPVTPLTPYGTAPDGAPAEAAGQFEQPDLSAPAAPPPAPVQPATAPPRPLPGDTGVAPPPGSAMENQAGPHQPPVHPDDRHDHPPAPGDGAPHAAQTARTGIVDTPPAD